MVRGFYISGTGLLTLERHMNVIANNVANAETTGYKSDAFVQRSFNDVLISRLNDPSVIAQTRQVGPLDYGVHVDELVVRYAQGAPQITERPYDFALLGENAFFSVQTPDGVRYTRDGSFHLDATNNGLVTADGFPVLGDNGPITIDGVSFAVNDFGDMMLDGQSIGRMSIVSFPNLADLRKEGSNLISGEGATPATDAAVKQGYVEASNVDMGAMTSDLLWVYRAYETNQKFIQMADSTMEIAVNRIGKV